MEFDLSILGDLAAKIGTQTEQLKRVTAALNRPPMQPFTFATNKTGTTPAANTNPYVIGLGGPAQGKLWDVRNIAISGLTTTTAVAGQADVFVRGDHIGAANTATMGQIGVTGWRDSATTLPLVAYYSSGQMRVRAGQKLWVVLSSYTVALEYVCQAEIEEFADAVYAQVVAQ